MTEVDIAGRRRDVGVDLQESGEDTRAVVEAISRDNPEAQVTTMPGLVRAVAPERLCIRRETVEHLLGRPWETHEFQLVIVSYFGNISDWDDDEIVIKWDH